MRHKNKELTQFWFLILILQLASSKEINNLSNLTEPINSSNDDPNLRSLITPQIDYDQWKPLGRGDPLKNDPTYDYVPPVLDRVQYWVDPALRKPDPPVPGENQKTEILLLGVTSKKPASGSSQADSRRDTYDPYLKYVPGSNFHPNSNQRIARPSFIPSIPTSFFPSFFSPSKNKYSDRTTFSKGTEQRVPYTMLMPPPPEDTGISLRPLPETPGPPITQKPTTQFVFTTTTPSSSTSGGTTSSVTVQTANLVYQSSSLSDASEFNGNNNRQPSDPSTVNWLSSTTTKGTIPNYREELVYNTHLAPPESYIEIEFSPHNLTNKPLIAADSNQNINYVTPPSTLNTQYKEVMFKGQVSDDNIDISNTYVKIGKPEAEVHSTGFGMSNVPIKSIVQHPVPSSVVMFPHSAPAKPKMPPLTMQTLQEMQTMHPPPVTQSPIFMKSTNPVISILEKEKSRPIAFKDLTSTPEITNYLGSSTSMINSFVTLPSTSAEKTTTTTAEPPTTTMTSLTTDPLFKHYKQPSEPLRGPLYMIIQGHSKVKTYGPSKQIHGILIQESNEIADDKYEETEYQVKHLHGFKKEGNVDEQPRKARSGNIQTLKHVVQTGFGSIDLSGVEEVKRRSSQDFQEAELQLGYEIADETEATTEKYHKGIVEEARKLKV
ncbi:uncharacterized protein LOC108912289 [Anoplophora glabripennis]|uniref:uncharacterized protein LOC108912289 n=1 Tax=Anoplophora glabripennis TaxID=217634 RepID=UPI000873F77D|nr:uncharacterized protein LOC108912289 [Anoplophora glabripennis]